MIRSVNTSPVVLFSEPLSPDADALREREQFERNWAWFKDHQADIYRPENGGLYFCIAEAELFLGESMHDAVQKAAATHPADKGRFAEYIPHRPARPTKYIYAVQRGMA